MEMPPSKFNSFGNFFKTNKDRFSKTSLHFEPNSIHNKENITDSYQDKSSLKDISHSNYQARPRSLDIRPSSQLQFGQNHTRNENPTGNLLAEFDRFFNSPKGVETELFKTQDKSLYNQTSPSQIMRSGLRSNENSLQMKIDNLIGSSVPHKPEVSSTKTGLASTQPIQERTSEKLTLYTKLLNEMKTMTLKNSESENKEQDGLGYKYATSPSDEKTKALDTKKPYLNLKVADLNSGKHVQRVNREDSKQLSSRQKTSFLAKKSGGSDENAKPRESAQKQGQGNMKDSKYQRQDRLSFSKKNLGSGVYVNSEPDLEERPSTTKATHSRLRYDNQGVYESVTNLRRTIDKSAVVQNLLSNSMSVSNGFKENAVGGNKKSGENVREAKPIFKSFTPKANTMTPSEVRKVLQSFQKTSQVEKAGSAKAQNRGDRNNSVGNKKMLDDETYQNYLRQGISKNEERPNTTGTSLQHKPASSVKSSKYRESSLSLSRKQEYQPSKVLLTQENEPGKEKEKSSKNSLKDFITQVNPGSMPIKTRIGTTAAGNERPVYSQIQPQSVKNSTKPVLNDRSPTVAGLFNLNKASNTTTHSSIAQDLKSFTFNSGLENRNTRRNTRNSEDKTSVHEPMAKKEVQAVVSAVCQYYMVGMETYLKKCSTENEYFAKIYREHFLQGYQAINFCKYLKAVDPLELAKRKVYLPKRETHKDKKTIIFDLDETLIHCNENANIPSDVVVPVKFPHGDIIEAGINIRPHAVEALQELSKHFEIIVFTASHSCYANVVLDHLDPENKYIHHRLFRESCVTTEEGLYVKDLRIFANRNLKDLVIVDNAMYSFGYQLENGIPIIPYYYNKADKELIALVKYLKGLADVRDVRDVNIRSFKLHIFAESESHEEVLQKLFE